MRPFCVQGKSWGPGRYMWVDGNEYDGEWAAGAMHGQGTFVWRTGERYDGEWRGGLEDGQGIFTWADGSVFDGFWSKGRKHGIGLYRVAAAPTRTLQASVSMMRHTQQAAEVRFFSRPVPAPVSAPCFLHLSIAAMPN